MLTPVKPTLDSEAKGRGLSFVEIAKEQPEYQTLPAYVNPAKGTVITQWTLSEEDLRRLNNGADLRLVIWTGGQPLQPLFLTTSANGIDELKEVGAL